VAETPSSSYDEVPYIAACFPQSHPDRLATLAKLLGMTPPPLDTCRVLELGCAGGDNLIPMAVTMPNASFVGIDLSQRQIEQGRQTVETLGLRNIELRHADINDVGADYGRFDYLIAHGVYSWVPEAVREKLLAICHDNLEPNGVAYVSYNTLPGWRMRGMIRDMMVYHSSQFPDAQQRVRQARALLDFLAQSAPSDTPYGMNLKQELDIIRTKPDSYIYHDHLEVVNEPVYFYEFAEKAKRHGLQYLADVEFSSMLLTNFPPQIAQTLQRLGTDPIRAEQYMDFMRNRLFRQTLLVHDELTIKRNIPPGALNGIYVASRAKAESPQPSLKEGAAEKFEGGKGTMTVVGAITKAALVLLAQRWPDAMRFEDLVLAAREKLLPSRDDGSAGRTDTEILANTLLQAYSIEAVEFHVHWPRMVTKPSARPLATPLVRLQASRGGVVTNLRHEMTKIDLFAQRLLPYLDGTRERAQLVDAMVDEAARGRFELRRKDGTRFEPGAELRQVIASGIDSALSNLAGVALLVE
jgi:methyltransferase-like protein